MNKRKQYNKKSVLYGNELRYKFEGVRNIVKD
ncbi:hypothetical protein SAMN05421578_104147 [Paenibacillus macquariensis]|uniref:Uncharacterized protein n=1 Tax=Paenibacillus macquariensis TaxID=948756 RepID=A0ABY1JUR6_9BACL|nr:hypothetical protein SAMN05421578_104147 [Paenibacillus macquariensis]